MRNVQVHATGELEARNTCVEATRFVTERPAITAQAERHRLPKRDFDRSVGMALFRRFPSFAIDLECTTNCKMKPDSESGNQWYCQDHSEDPRKETKSDVQPQYPC